MSTRILLADDHRMMRDGLRTILEAEPGLEVVGEAVNGRTAVELARELMPDVVVMDIAMSDMNGIEATRRIVADNPEVKIVALSTYADRRYVLEMLDAGASGYVVKAAACEELVQAISIVARGKSYLSPEITGIVVDGYVGRQFAGPGAPGAALGAREREVLQLVAEGNSSREIAASLKISLKTVEAHRRNIMEKLGLHTVAELTKYAIREGLTSLES